MKKAVMYGAGNIGRGFIGQLLSQSDYEVTFIDINEKIIDRLNSDKKYTIHIVSNDEVNDVVVENVCGINGTEEAVVEEIFSADIMATAVGVNVIKFIAPIVAEGLEKRIAERKPPLNIILCENLIKVDEYFKAEIFKYLSEYAKSNFRDYVGLVEASIGRMVPVIASEDGDNPLTVCVEEFDILHVDKDGFVGNVPNIKNLLPYSPFKFFIQRKLYIHNMCHALSAYLGYLKGYQYINDAISCVDIKYCVLKAGMESACAIALDNDEQLIDLQNFLYKLIYRFNNSALKDTIDRVAKDPIRKLKRTDRLCGAFLLCKQHGIQNIYIKLAIAAAMCFDAEGDDSAKEVQKDISENGFEYALKKYTEVDFSAQEMRSVFVLYNMLKEKSLSELIAYCEKVEADAIVNR
ncbi:MAG: mannitol dehydrogenase [Kiritimatiellae bacterium]|jgi:mannitol-1-phosphate 5-dehydrogenase|nr:mannitol dehydrogenase [Kiritimatiellia bacterium]